MNKPDADWGAHKTESSLYEGPRSHSDQSRQRLLGMRFQSYQAARARDIVPADAAGRDGPGPATCAIDRLSHALLHAPHRFSSRKRPRRSLLTMHRAGRSLAC